MSDEETAMDEETQMIDAPDLEDGAALEDDDWPVKGPARGIRLGIPVALLVAVLLVALGFWGGAVVEKNHGSSSSSAAAFASRFRGLRFGASGASGPSGPSGATGAGGIFGGGAAGTTGTISVVDGETLYVLTSTGALVKVSLASSTTVTRDATSTPVDLRPGDTVVIQGATDANGNVSATSIAATAPGVSSSAGGFGRGFGAAPSGTSTTASGG